ncbi:MAG TPA: DUF4349 domain-containing protein, partial [Candidatus Limnocylindrales bacterium]
MRTSRAALLKPLTLLLGALVVVACSASGAAPILSTVGAPVPGNGGAAEQPAAQPPALSGDGSTANQPPLYDINDASLLIIKTGSIDLQVAAIDDALAAASTKIVGLGGYASGSQRSGDGESASAQVTYRIPSAKWDEALVDLRAIGLKVLSEQSQTQDVTGQVVDLGARITNLQATEAALQAIMAKAEKISDVLAVQQQLTDVRGQIEQATAEKNHLQQQAAFSTLTVSYSLKEVAVQTTAKQFDPNDEVDKASASLVGVLQALATAGIWFGIVWLPILLALSIVGGLV